MNTDLFSLDQTFLSSDYPNYAFKVYKILKAYNENKEKGIRLAQDSIKNKEYFIKIVEKLNKKYSNMSQYEEALSFIILSYDNIVKKSDKYVDYSLIKTDCSEKKELLTKIYNSGLSVLDYYYYNTTFININTFINDRRNENNKMALEIKKRKNTTIPMIINIINKINNGEMDYVGYYETTCLYPYFLMEIAKEYNLYTEIVADFIRTLRNPNCILVNKELNGSLVISNEEVPREIKEQAIEYLKSIEAPLDINIYNNMVKRLIKSSK